MRLLCTSLVTVATLVSVVLIGGGAAQASSARPVAAAKPMFPATGFFRVAQKKQRWYLVTPQGQPFYAAGVDTVSPIGDTDQVTGQCPYCQAVAGNYPDVASWATATVARLRSWGFNSLGSYSDNSLLGASIPHTVELAMASGNDWFAPSFVTHADQVAATQAAPLANDPNVIGYFTDSELTWGPLSGSSLFSTLLDLYLALPAGSPGLAVAQQYIGNPAGFLTAVATRYFQVTSAALHQYDPNHLNLGVKAEGQEIQPELLEAAKPYVDVFSIEDYTLSPGFAGVVDKLFPYYLPVEPNLANFEQYVQRPLMIGEYTSIATNPATPNTHPGIYAVSPDQPTRAADYAGFIAPLYESSPWLVGDNWFEYVDEPQGGRTGDGENDNFGLVNVQDQPYQNLVSAMSTMHSIAPDRLVQSGPTCDSWADGPGGVTCTAYMPNPTYPLQIVDSSVPVGTVGTSYTADIYAGGGRPTYSFSLSQGSLPRGLKLKAKTGTIMGTPKVAGTFAVTVAVKDSAGSPPASLPLSITIAPA